MTLKEFYQNIDGDYEDVIGRIGSEERVQPILAMFREDSSYQWLAKAIEGKDWDSAFDAAHTLKGLCLSLGFAPITPYILALTDALREGQRDIEPVPYLWQKVQRAYARVMDALKRLR